MASASAAAGAGADRARRERPALERAEWARSRAGRAGIAAALAAAAMLVAAAHGAAQQLGVELKAGAAVGNYSDTDAGLDLLPRPSFGLLMELRTTERLSGYLGITSSSFGCDEGLCSGQEVSLTSQGLVAGARWSPGLPWLRAGVALQKLDVSARGGDERSDAGLGVELAAGLDVPIWDRLRIRPGVTYLRHAASTAGAEGHVTLLALEIGAALYLPGF